MIGGEISPASRTGCRPKSPHTSRFPLILTQLHIQAPDLLSSISQHIRFMHPTFLWEAGASLFVFVGSFIWRLVRYRKFVRRFPGPPGHSLVWGHAKTFGQVNQRTQYNFNVRWQKEINIMIIWYVLICFAIKVKFADIARETGLDVFYLDVYPFAWVGSSIFVDNGRKRSSLPTLKSQN